MSFRMVTFLKVGFIISFLSMITACDFFQPEFSVGENYYVATSDSERGRSLFYRLSNGSGIGRVNNSVTAVGWDEKYIFVEKTVSEKKSYYLIDIESDQEFSEVSDVVRGPYNIDEFVTAYPGVTFNGELLFKKRFKK